MYPPHSLELKTAPAVEPITRVEAYAQERLTPTMSGSPLSPSHPEDALIDIYIAGARQWAENKARRALITQTWTMRMDRFPSSGDIEIPLRELQSVSSIKYYDEDGNLQTWSDALYEKDTHSNPGRVQPIDGETYPDVNPQLNAVEIEFVAGYGADGTAIPQNMKMAMLMVFGSSYQNREDNITGTIAVEVPRGADNLLQSYIDKTETREEI